MPAIGPPSRAHIRMIYTISPPSRVAGALLAETTETRVARSLSFDRRPSW